MALYKFLVITNPAPGRDADYNDWYDRQHVHDVLRVPGFRAAQRYRAVGDTTLPGRYVAIYELETDDPARTLAELNGRAGGAQMPLTDALDVATASATLLEPLAEPVSARTP